MLFRSCNENVTLKLNFAFYFKCFAIFPFWSCVQKIGEVSFHCIGTTDFHVRMEDLLQRARAVVKYQYENFTSSFDRLRHKIAPKSVQHDHFASFNQSNH